MNDPLRLIWRTFHLPKAGYTLAEYEDAFAGAPEQGRFAIADGASESAFAGAWARLVVDAFVQTPGPWSGWLPGARQRWHVQGQKRELPWYAETKFQEGAYAALLGIAFRSDRWRAVAVGDCCLFQVRAGRLLRAFPMRHSRDFSNRPSLLGSRNRLPDQPRARRLRLQGEFRTNDIFFLMTDALAEWFLKNVEAERQPWTELQTIETQEQFAEFTKKLREAKGLRNDDVTLMMINPDDEFFMMADAPAE